MIRMELDTERPPIADSPLSLILVVPGADAAVREALSTWVTFLNGLDRDYELLLTGERPDVPVDSLASGYSRARGLTVEGAGFGAALRVGLRAARFPLVCYARWEPWLKPSELKSFLRRIDKVDLVTGYRQLPPGSRMPWSDWAYRWFVRLAFGVPMRDNGCLFLMARRSGFARIVVQSDSLFAHVEVLAKANFLGSLMDEAPVSCPSLSPRSDCSCRGIFADARQVFSHPDFGPVVVHGNGQVPSS